MVEKGYFLYLLSFLINLILKGNLLLMALSRVSRELVLINSLWLQPADQRKLSEKGFSPIYSFPALLYLMDFMHFSCCFRKFNFSIHFLSHFLTLMVEMPFRVFIIFRFSSEFQITCLNYSK